MKTRIQAGAWRAQARGTVSGASLAALSLLAALLGAAPRAQAQPTVVGTTVYTGGYATYDLAPVGGFRQYRAQATVGSVNNGREWQFDQGTAANTDYSQKWMPYNSNGTRYAIANFNAFIAPSTAYPPTTGTATYAGYQGTPGGLPPTTAGNYYTFNITSNAPNANNNMAVLETTFNPVTIGAPTAPAPAYGQPATITATLGATPSTGENFYLRYTTDGFTTSSIVQMASSPNSPSISGTIPGRASGTVTYYIFSSSEALTQLNNDFSTYGQGSVYDMASLNLSTGNSYTVGGALSGTYTVDQMGGGLPNFTTMTAAFNAVNAGGVAGAVVFNVKDGQIFNESNLNLIAPAGTSSTNTITFQRDASGTARPLVQPPSTAAPGRQDAVIKLQGADYVTFDGIDVGEYPSITAGDLAAGDNRAMEYGYALFRNSATDGSQHNNVRNSTVTLNPNNGNTTYGIWIANTGIDGTIISATSAAGANSANSLLNNRIISSRNGIGAAGSGLNDQGNLLGNLADVNMGNIISVVQTFGIIAYNQSNLLIASNTVSFATNNTGYMYGIVVGDNTAGALVARNTVRTLKYAGNGGVGVRGISIDPGNITANIEVRNNAVSNLTADGDGSSNVNQLMGIGILSGTGFNIYNNSVQLNGDRADNTFSNKVSAALFVNNGVGGIDLRNNILSNVQTSSDTDAGQQGTNYAVYVQDAAAQPFTTIDYNLYDLRTTAAGRPGTAGRTTAASAQYLGHLLGNDIATLAAWQAATGQDRSSMLSQGASANALGFSSATNLMPNPADPNAYVLNGMGVQIASVDADLPGSNRPTTVAAGAPDLGAYELNPTAAPNPLAVSGPPALGGTQVFSLNGRTIATLTYGTTGTVPTSVTGRYYSGTNPPLPYAAGARTQNDYFAFSNDNNDGSGYTYTLQTFYDPASLGTIGSEGAQRLQQRTADMSGYSPVATTVDQTNRNLTSTVNLTRLSIFAVSDAAAPLPVVLTAFTATRQGQNAQLDWATASELGNAGFEVQVSTSGAASDFRPLGFVAAPTAGSRTARTYTFLDQEASKAGLRYYRLRQLDLDGTATYSPVRTVQFDAPTAMQVLAWPNPFAQVLHLTVALPQAVLTATLTLTDALGRQVLHQELGALPAGTSQPALSEVFGQLPAGFYVLRLATPTGTQVLKVVRN